MVGRPYYVITSVVAIFVLSADVVVDDVDYWLYKITVIMDAMFTTTTATFFLF